MKAVILAGGLPSTVSEKDEKVPKPMAEIGGRPILWHIMKQYSFYGIRDFIICTGFKGNMIKQYFMDYYIYQSDITVHLAENQVEIHRKQTEDWNVTIVDTGITATIGERILQVKNYLSSEFIVSYGDCVSDIDIEALLKHHRESTKTATLAVARPTGRNEILPIDSNGTFNYDNGYSIKTDAWVNGCNMVFNSQIFEFLNKEDSFLEKSTFLRLAEKGEISAYRHEGFWSPMETKRDQSILEHLWKEGKAPWKVWN